MSKRPSLADVTSYFYKGNFKEVLDYFGRTLPPQKTSNFEELAFLQLGSLVFRGEFNEAKLNYQKALTLGNRTSLFLARCRFYLGVGCVRRSFYAEATTYFSQNLSSVRNSKSSKEEIFYAKQGAAFFHFYKGQFRKTNTFAEEAYEAAFSSNFIYGQILSLDLLGHSLCQLGLVRRGIFELERALQLAIDLGNGGIEVALRISLVKYRAQFGIELDTSLDNMNHMLKSLNPQDTYSRAELYLELARQLILRGDGREAKNQLDQAGELIYKHQNKRQSAVYNLRFAYLMFLRGEHYAALALLRSIEISLDKKLDLIYRAQTEALEQKIMHELRIHESAKNLLGNKDKTVFLNSVDQRIKSRNLGLEPSTVLKGEDPLGDLIDQVDRDGFSSYAELKKHKLMGLFPRALKIPPGTIGIFLGPARNEIIILNGADIFLIENGITSPMKKLITLLASSEFKSKEYLIQKTWNYTYDPRRHDSLLYATIGKLRKLLGEFSYWLEWANEGYRLAPFVKVLSLSQDLASKNPESSKSVLAFKSTELSQFEKTPSSSQPSVYKNLNLRQIKTLQSMKEDLHFNVRSYAKSYKVCTMTAYRDLNHLHQEGYLLRIGSGRATVYMPNKEDSFFKDLLQPRIRRKKNE